MDLLTHKSCLLDYSAFSKLYLATRKCEAFFLSCSSESFTQPALCFLMHLITQKMQTSNSRLTFFLELFRLQKINPRWEIRIEMPNQYWTGMTQTGSSVQPELPLITISQIELQDQGSQTHSFSSDFSLNIYI